jgi:hypothetical protein
LIWVGQQSTRATATGAATAVQHGDVVRIVEENCLCSAQRRHLHQLVVMMSVLIAPVCAAIENGNIACPE